MAEVLVQDSSLQDIANAIREKNGTETTYKPSEMGDAVREISGGGGGGVPPEALVLTGNCSYRFANNGWNWFLEEYEDQITTDGLNNATYMFFNSTEIQEIPFEIVFNNQTNYTMYSLCENMGNLKTQPIIQANNSTISVSGGFQNFFQSCNMLREVSLSKFQIDFNAIHEITNTSFNFNSMFSSCYSLRTVDEGLLKNLYTNVNSTSFFQNMFFYCCSLDEIKGFPVVLDGYKYNLFLNIFTNATRLKNLIFDKKEDGTVKSINWTNQTITLSDNVGYSNSYGKRYILNYNSGITADKEVKDDATYQALKNDPDWFTTKIEYSRYNHDSAVNTINSLPDVSSGTGNTIKFKGESGSLTDGGAINTLTPEEIAVASAKGWTVTLV